jgi:hypothetical protein
MTSDPSNAPHQQASGTGAILKAGDLLTLRTESGSEVVLEVAMIAGIPGEVVEPMSLYPTSGVNGEFVFKKNSTLMKQGDLLTLTTGNSLVHARIISLGRHRPRIDEVGALRVVTWSHPGEGSKEQVDPQPTSNSKRIVETQVEGSVLQVEEKNPASTASPESNPSQGASTPTQRRPTPVGKVKASFNLLPEDINSLRVMAQRLGTTITNALQRAIRDERFIQQQLEEGNKFAIVDQRGEVREIIWR